MVVHRLADQDTRSQQGQGRAGQLRGDEARRIQRADAANVSVSARARVNADAKEVMAVDRTRRN